MKARNKHVRDTLWVIIILLLAVTIFVKEPITTSLYDKILFKLSNIFLIMGIVFPIIILTTKKIKLKLPFFRKKKWWLNTFGGVIIFLVFALISNAMSFFHTEEFQIRYEEYLKEMSHSSETLKEEINQKQNELMKSNEKSDEQGLNKEAKLIIHYLNVGQGDSILIELPTKEILLIDAGEAKESDNIIAYIKSLGYEEIDYLIGTHPHADHIGGLEKIIKTFLIKNIYMPKAIATSKTYENLLKTIAGKNMTVKNAKAGVSIINQEDLKILFLAPNSNSYSKINNYSAVLKLEYKKRQFLFMGDAEVESEEEIKEEISADVIKIGHHGSNTSTSQSFLERVKPTYAIISVGKENKYQHPHAEIINRLKNNGIDIYQTDEDGTIKVITDGEAILIDSQNGKNNYEINEKAKQILE